MEHIPYTVIGGGICGVLTAIQLKEKFPQSDILLLEKEPYLGHHSTTRNSGVLHAGIYYDTGSLKHRLCMAGRQNWIELARLFNIPINICGKYIIATQESERPTLEGLFQKASQNHVPDIRPMSSIELKEIQDSCHAISGFVSPHTGILDISSGINILRDHLLALGGIVLINTEVLGLQSKDEQILVKTPTNSFLTDVLVNCAGVGAVNLRKKLNLLDFEDQFVKGNYLKLKKAFYNKKLIYPVPNKNLYGLGVHTSFHMDGSVRFGPNTEPTAELNYENYQSNIELMYPAIQETFKNIKDTDLSPDYTGIRTKIIRNGQLYVDFLIQGPNETKIPGYFEMLGIESPGLTAAPAIASHIVAYISQLK